MALKPALLEMSFDMTVTKMQAERKQRDSKDPRERESARDEKG